MRVVEGIESKPHKAVTFLAERYKEMQDWCEQSIVTRTYDNVIASHSRQGKINNIEEFESRPHKAVGSKKKKTRAFPGHTGEKLQSGRRKSRRRRGGGKSKGGEDDEMMRSWEDVGEEKEKISVRKMEGRSFQVEGVQEK